MLIPIIKRTKDEKTRQETPEQLEKLRWLETVMADWRDRRIAEMNEEARKSVFFINLGEKDEDRDTGIQGSDGD